jgi:hypothetical protein
MFNLKFFANFKLIEENFNNSFFWTSFLDLNDFCFDFFSDYQLSKKVNNFDFFDYYYYCFRQYTFNTLNIPLY